MVHSLSVTKSVHYLIIDALKIYSYLDLVKLHYRHSNVTFFMKIENFFYTRLSKIM